MPAGIRNKPSAEVQALRAEVDRYKAWVNDLHSGMYINCVYCGHQHGPKNKVPASMADVLKEHIEKCPKHPMSTLRASLAEAEAGWKAMSNEQIRLLQVERVLRAEAERLQSVISGYREEIAATGHRENALRTAFAEKKKEEESLQTVCIECGPIDSCDEDGCCSSCGADVVLGWGIACLWNKIHADIAGKGA